MIQLLHIEVLYNMYSVRTQLCISIYSIFNKMLEHLILRWTVNNEIQIITVTIARR
jgi:hypothetical protein